MELGGGMTGLAGLMIAQACQPAHVEITDGNENSVENLDILLHENRELGLLKNNVSSRVSHQYTVNIFGSKSGHF